MAVIPETSSSEILSIHFMGDVNYSKAEKAFGLIVDTQLYAEFGYIKWKVTGEIWPK